MSHVGYSVSRLDHRLSSLSVYDSRAGVYQTIIRGTQKNMLLYAQNRNTLTDYFLLLTFLLCPLRLSEHVLFHAARLPGGWGFSTTNQYISTRVSGPSTHRTG